MNRAVKRQVAGVAGLLAVVAIAHLLAPNSPLAALDALTDRPVHFGAVLVVVYLLRPLVAWPISLVSIVVGYAYGVWLGVPIALGGSVLTSLGPYYVARSYRPEDGPIGRLGDRGREAVAASGDTRAVLAARLAPVPGDAVSVGAGLANVSLGAFVLGTLLGQVPWSVAAVLAGSSLDALRMGGVTDPDPALIAAAALAAVLVLARPIQEQVPRPGNR
jgi:uncharacterized membrane protein YdjX (TVP38/TMEM64 family)